MRRYPFPSHVSPCLYVVALFTAILYVSSARAAFIVDDFSTSQTLGSSSSGTVTGSGILGSERYAWANNYVTAQISTSVANQAVLYFDPDPTAMNGFFTLRYDGVGSSNTGLNNMDLTNAGMYSGFEIVISQVSSNGNSYCSFRVGQGSNQASEYYFNFSQAGSYFVPFADFEVALVTAALPDGDVRISAFSYTEVDFSDVGYIEMTISTSVKQTIILDSFSVVPEPAAISLLAFGGILLRRRRP